MTFISRQEVMAGLRALGAACILPTGSDERCQHANALLHYFAENAPLLLRAPDGILTHPSVPPSLPSKRYSTQLWDWDTLWTSRGLLRFAALEHDESLKQKLCEHVSGSQLNFLNYASNNRQIP